jgi:hypothetical protein
MRYSDYEEEDIVFLRSCSFTDLEAQKSCETSHRVTTLRIVVYMVVCEDLGMFDEHWHFV